jgi:5,10-methylenetetrahydromethanopterin reductase
VKFGVIYQSFDPPDVFLDLVRQIEQAGFDDLWVCDSSLHARDVIAYLTLAAVNTSRIRLGVTVFQPYTRHPAIDVNGILTVNEISNGRARMAVGAGDRPQLELGFAPAPVSLVREMIESSRRLIAGESVTLRNPVFQMSGARARHNTPGHVPIYVACSGPRMLQMAGELADGVIVMAGATPETVEYGLSHVHIGFERSSRSNASLDVAWGAATVIADDPREALAETRLMAAWFANHSAGYAEKAGASAELVEAMRSQDQGRNLHEARDAAALAPDAIVDQLALAGPPGHIVERIHAVHALGIDHFELFLIGRNKLRTLQRFAAEVMPAFRRST